MERSNELWNKSMIAGLIAAFLSNSFAYAAPQQVDPSSAPSNQISTTNRTVESPDSLQTSIGTGTVLVSSPASLVPQSDAELPDSPIPIKTATLPIPIGFVLAPRSSSQADSQTPVSQPTPSAPQNNTHEPLGTAAAESVPTMGIAASRPAGAALAPPKQRRVRSILIKTGAVIAAGVAVGVVVALSEGSPSKPPGAR
jgi:cytoskeletal protein RodZ